MHNGLYIVATPIGNLGDISPRAVETLKEADVIACEDTRITKKLFALLNISTANKKFIVYQNYNEEDESQNILDLAINENKSIALVSDAGSPLISDPGYKLIHKAREQGVFVSVLPGCCALICALQLSGHTHGGQIYGMHWLAQLINKGFVKDKYQIGDMLLYVNRGTGLWYGFPIRLGIPSEITVVTLKTAQ